MSTIDLIATVAGSPVPTKVNFKEWIKSAPESVRFLPAHVTTPLHEAFRNLDAAHIPDGQVAIVHGKRWTATIVRKGDKLTVK